MEKGLTKRQIERIYTFYSFFYNWTFGLVLSPRIKYVFKNMWFKERDRILEVGIGTGLSLKYYPPGVKVVGIDISFGMLKRALEFCSEMETLSLFQMDALNISFRDASFDWVVCAFVVSTLPNVRIAMKEIWRVVKPDGKVIIINHFLSKNRLISKIERLIDPITRKLGWITNFSEEELTSLGFFKVENVFKKRFYSPWKVLVLTPIK